MSSPSQAPALSVILPCEEGFRYIRQTIEALQQQTICRQIELVLIVRDALSDGELAEIDGFHSVRVVVDRGLMGNRARAAGIRAASAPIVASAEDHCYPEPRWAASLLAAFADGWSAVGPSMYNGNPASALSWVNLLLAFGPWVAPAAAGPIVQLPWHNTSYQRLLLVEYGDSLGELMDVEGLLQEDLARKGHRFYHAVDARVHHLNVSRVSSTITYRLDSSRLFAAYRSRGWSALRRLLYVLAAPLIPIVRLRRTLPLLRKVEGGPGLHARVLAVAAVCLIIDSIGETIGYALGSTQRLVLKVEGFERLRFRHMSRADRRLYDRGRLAPVTVMS